MTNPEKVILILTGAWHVPQHYHKVVNQLESSNLRVICPQLPTNNNAIPPNKTLADDCAFVKSVVAEEVAKGTHLYVLAHSYGGLIATASLADFALHPGSGKGGVANIIFMCAFVPNEDQSLAGMFGGQLPPYLTTDPETKTLIWSDPIPHMYHDLPKDEARWAENLRVAHPHDAQFTPIQCKTAAWRVIPVTYLVCEDDRALPGFVQESMVESLRKQNMDVTVFRCSASHSPFLSMPEKVVEVVMKVTRS